jgi:SAM-dependent methyltransferase
VILIKSAKVSLRPFLLTLAAGALSSLPEARAQAVAPKAAAEVPEAVVFSWIEGPPAAARDREFEAVRSEAGVIADARRLPLRDGSVSMLVSKNFPWMAANKPRVQALIDEVLSEFRRVSAEGGVILLLMDSKPPLSFEEKMRYHRKAAERLGFAVRPVRGSTVSGWALSAM